VVSTTFAIQNLLQFIPYTCDLVGYKNIFYGVVAGEHNTIGELVQKGNI
jgi:hypothetical protein